MPRKSTTVEPPVKPTSDAVSFNMYVQRHEREEFDAIARAMNGSRADAFRWLLSLAREKKGRAK